MSRRLRLTAAWALAALCLAGALYLGGLLLTLSRPYAGWEGEQVDLELEPGLDAGTMLQRLHEAGVVSHPQALRIWLRWSGGSEALQAGEYRFQTAATPLQVLDRLSRGDVLLHAVTVPEGLALEEIAARLADAGFGPRERFRELFRDPGPVRELDPAADDLEGYLFPDTYSFPRNASPQRITAAMVERFREVTGPAYATAAEQAGLDLRRAVTLASLIEKETSLPEERGRISRVFHNRLARGMLLQCDPTVLYALRRDGIAVTRLTYDHLTHDSPWNTYVSPGLPPGPIASPGAASLEAAVHPAEGNDLYFVASPGGGHRFSSDLDSHRKAVREWRNYLRSSR